MSRSKQCPFCGSSAELQSQQEEIAVGRRTASVEAESYQCVNCGEEFVEDWQVEEAQRRASQKIREEEGLLTGEEILEIREESLGLSQKSFEKLLGVGPKTATRWENNTVFQNSATDNLLRVVRDVPGAAAYLAEINDVELQRRRYIKPDLFVDKEVRIDVRLHESGLNWLEIKVEDDKAEPRPSTTGGPTPADLRVV